MVQLASALLVSAIMSVPLSSFCAASIMLAICGLACLFLEGINCLSAFVPMIAAAIADAELVQAPEQGVRVNAQKFRSSAWAVNFALGKCEHLA